MHILFFSHYFPPEGNAPASRVHATCRRWAAAGHQVTVITGVPNVPDGKVYPGYRNRLKSRRETIDGIQVIRVWTYIAANAGTGPRIANYLSYMLSAALRSFRLPRPDIIIATSPQFFCGWAGAIAAGLKRTPFILEVRDLWPDSIVAVGAMQNPRLLAAVEWLEHRLYHAADHIVTVGPGYQDRLIEKNVPPHHITVIPNGVDKDLFYPRQPDVSLAAQHGLQNKFVCSYIGTIGMACGLEVVLEAAHLLIDRHRDDIRFLLVGDGARREELQRHTAEQNLPNVIFTGRQDKSLIPAYLSISDCCLVHLTRTPLFKTVLPSKIFEAAAMARPIILGVEGSAADLVRDSAAGICIQPQNPVQLADTVIRLADDPALRENLGRQGHDRITAKYDRDTLAQEYLQVVQQMAQRDDT